MLRASYEQVQPSTTRNAFLMRVFGREAFDAPYHFHPEYELTLILEGRGRRFAGSNMAGFREGDLALLGPNLPHCWKLDPGVENGSAIVLQFAPGFLGDDFFSVPEMQPVRQALQRSAGGLEFGGKTREQAARQLVTMSGEENNFDRMILLLKVLRLLSESQDYLLLNREAGSVPEAPADRERINAVLTYLAGNFREGVSLHKAAEIVSMTPNAFCKYFKKITRKTFFETVMEYRLSWAARELAQTDKPVSAICYDSGFGDMSHFNKTFKSKMGVSPLAYRKKFGV